MSLSPRNSGCHLSRLLRRGASEVFVDIEVFDKGLCKVLAFESLLPKPLSLVPDVLGHHRSVWILQEKVEEDVLWRDVRTSKGFDQRLLFICELPVAWML
jgi:hypothetical protein